MLKIELSVSGPGRNPEIKKEIVHVYEQEQNESLLKFKERVIQDFSAVCDMFGLQYHQIDPHDPTKK